MKYVNKYSVSGVVVLGIILLGGLYTADIFEDKIIVKMPSDYCTDATLRVTKDDFTLKCGWRIAFQADTVIDYFKTYGKDEWVRNSRYVGANKKDIDLELIEHQDYFDIVRTTKYRKGKQYVLDGVLQETYTFTKDKVKITYNYVVDNKAKHKISMRIKKQYKSNLDAFDPNGYIGIQSGNVLYYEGYGNMFIDPSVLLDVTPSDKNTAWNEGDTISFICNATSTVGNNPLNLSLIWDADGTDRHNVSFATGVANFTATFSAIIPHVDTSDGNINWTCMSCNSTECNNGTLRSIRALYKPNSFSLTLADNVTEVIDGWNRTDVGLNLLYGTGWGITTIYPTYYNGTDGGIWLNWSTDIGLPGTNMNVTWNLSYNNNSGGNETYYWSGTDNVTNRSYFTSDGLASGNYTVTLTVCNRLNTSLCVNDSLNTTINIFDYDISTATPELRFSPLQNINMTPAYGQTGTQPFIEIDWIGWPIDGNINLTLNVSDYTTNCLDFTLMAGNTSHNFSTIKTLANDTIVTILTTATAVQDGIWIWANKSTCLAAETNYTLSVGVLW